MIDAKEAIFSTIRKSLAESAPFDAEHQRHHRPHQSYVQTRTVERVSREEVVAGFKESLDLVGAKHYLASSVESTGEIISEIIRTAGAKRVAVSDSPLLEQAIPFERYPEFNRNFSVADLFDHDLGITSAQWAIAETGTLVLESDRENHRYASLIPPVHVCVLRADSIRERLDEILSILSSDLSRAVTFVTGASRTSDIELTLAVGVHGPGELHVIIINDKSYG